MRRRNSSHLDSGNLRNNLPNNLQKQLNILQEHSIWRARLVFSGPT